MPCEVHVPMLQSMLERRTFYETWSVSGGTLRTVVASVRGSVFERGRLAGGWVEHVTSDVRSGGLELQMVSRSAIRPSDKG